MEEAARRYDLSPLDEEFLLAEARRVARDRPLAPAPAPGGVATPRPQDEYLTDEGVRILENWNRPSDPGVSIARARLGPGEESRWHYLVDTVERYLVIRGSGAVELGDAPAQPLAPGDVVLIPAGVAQRVRCDPGSELEFYCICTPRFEERNYRAGKPGE